MTAAREKAALALVDQSPEAGLRSLFRQEAELERDLRRLRVELALQRRCYATKHGLLVLPSIDHLRRLFSL